MCCKISLRKVVTLFLEARETISCKDTPFNYTENTELNTDGEAYGNYLAFRNRDPSSKHRKQRIFIKLVTDRHFRCAACFGEATSTYTAARCWHRLKWAGPTRIWGCFIRTCLTGFMYWNLSEMVSADSMLLCYHGAGLGKRGGSKAHVWIIGGCTAVV